MLSACRACRRDVTRFGRNRTVAPPTANVYPRRLLELPGFDRRGGTPARRIEDEAATMARARRGDGDGGHDHADDDDGTRRRQVSRGGREGIGGAHADDREDPAE